MPQATQAYPQYNPSACTGCQACLNNCPIACIYFDPLFIMSDECILCAQCIPACPEGDGVVFAQGSKLLGKEWQWFVQPPASEIEESPSNPNESESSADSSASEKDNELDSSQESNNGDSSTESKEEQNESKGESKGESTQNPSYTPADKAKLEALKNALLSAPPPYKIQASTKAINALDSLKRYISTMS